MELQKKPNENIIALFDGLLLRETRLTPEEMRFLSSQVGLKIKDIAKCMGVKSEHLSRALHGKMKLGKSSEKMFRLVVAAWKRPKIERQVLYVILKDHE